LRPEEAVSLRKHNLRDVPAEGWGEIHLDTAEPFAGKEWTDSGENRDRRGLKQRAKGEGRTVPCPPELTSLLNEHIGRLGYAHDGRVFVGARNLKELPKGTINRAWREARQVVFTPEIVDSPLAETPYDLHHAMISLWIMLGISVADIVRWAGHSIDVLFAIYAAWLSNTIKLWQNKIDEGLGR
jgi:integrase